MGANLIISFVGKEVNERELLEMAIYTQYCIKEIDERLKPSENACIDDIEYSIETVGKFSAALVGLLVY